MAIKTMNREESYLFRMETEYKKLKELEREMVDNIKTSTRHLTDLDNLHEIQDHIDDLVRNWEDKEFDMEDED